MPRHIGPSLVHQPGDSAQEFPARDAAIHDLANLVDAAMRTAAAARRGTGSERSIAALEAALAQMGDLLAVLSPPARSPGPRDGALSVFDAVQRAVDLMHPLAQEQGVILRVELGDGLSEFAAPGLFRALTDALRNSLESIAMSRCTAGGSNGAVVVTARIENGAVVLQVNDDGGGPTDALGDPFSPGTSSKAGSAGLGLAVARHIVERLRGRVTLVKGSGTLPGRPGAVLTFTIPVDALKRLPATSPR